MKEKILITGSQGLLGQYLVRIFSEKGFDVHGTGRGEARFQEPGWQYHPLDITDGPAVAQLITTLNPAQIIHAAAITQVDRAETNPIECWNTNVTATRFIVDTARQIRSRVIFISSDFVFSGKDGPYNEFSLPSPVNYYGSSKWAAEKAVLAYTGNTAVVRTVLVLGKALQGTRATLVSWVLESLRAGKEIKVVTDQRRSATLVTDLAQGILRLAETKADGIFHISGEETYSPYEIAIETARLAGLDESLIIPVNNEIFTQPAQRPKETIFVLNKARKELGYTPHSLKQGLEAMLR